MPDLPKGLRFDVYERVHLPDEVPAISELEEMELVPHIQAIHQDDSVLLRGNLLLAGIYRAKEGEDVSHPLEHWIPVEITLPLQRVSSLEELTIEVDNFDVDLLSARSLNITGVISLMGLQMDRLEEGEPWEEEEPITVVHSLEDQQLQRNEIEADFQPQAGSADEVPALQPEVLAEAVIREEAVQVDEALQESKPQAEAGAEAAFWSEQASAGVRGTRFGDISAERTAEPPITPVAPFIPAEAASTPPIVSTPFVAERQKLQREQPPSLSQLQPQSQSQLQSQPQSQSQLQSQSQSQSQLQSQPQSQSQLQSQPQSQSQLQSQSQSQPQLQSQSQSQPQSQLQSQSQPQSQSPFQSSFQFQPQSQQEELVSISSVAASSSSDSPPPAEPADEPDWIPLSASAQPQPEPEAEFEPAEQQAVAASAPLAADEPAAEQGAPAEEVKREPKIALGTKPTESKAGLMSLLHAGQREHEARVIAERAAARAEAEAARTQQQAYEEVEWQKLFLSREQEERSFKKVRLAIVQREDTLEAIAGRYQINPRELVLYNRLAEPAVSEGQVLYIP